MREQGIDRVVLHIGWAGGEEQMGMVIGIGIDALHERELGA